MTTRRSLADVVCSLLTSFFLFLVITIYKVGDGKLFTLSAGMAIGGDIVLIL